MFGKKKKEKGSEKAEKSKEKKDANLLDDDLNGVSGGNLSDMPTDIPVPIPPDTTNQV